MHGYDMEKLAGTFNRVAPFYDIVRPLFIRPYRKAVRYTLNELKSGENPPRVLDIGTGTGTLAGIFADRGAKVTGVDISPEMLNQARKKYGSRVSFLQAPAHAPGLFGNDSFDVVSAAFVLHEMPPDYRIRVLEEMKRLARRVVLVIDYVPNCNPLISLVEHLEKSYYRDFLGSVKAELNNVFSRHICKRMSHFIGMYLCDSRNY
ncbi:MAG: class I SAM-dependent methyltransferase [Bacillota bacterium]